MKDQLKTVELEIVRNIKIKPYLRDLIIDLQNLIHRKIS